MTAQLAGDARLGLRLAGLLGRRHPVAAAAVVTPSAVRATADGADLDTAFELAPAGS